MKNMLRHSPHICLTALGLVLLSMATMAEPYLDNQTQYSNQDPSNETRRSDHFRLCFGQYNRDNSVQSPPGGQPQSVGMTERLAQGNLRMYEQMWNRWVAEMGLNDLNESGDPAKRDGNKYRSNFNFLMTWNDGGGGGAYMSADANGFAYAMANPTYCRWDPPSGATPHEHGHVWEGTTGGFNGSNSSGMWWECTANWMQLQFLNTYPTAQNYVANAMYYPAHGRDFYDSWAIWEAARGDPRYGGYWVNKVWTDANASQRVNEYILDRMIRVDTSGSPDKAGAVKDLWGDMARKCITWDFERQQWLKADSKADDGTDWEFYRKNRTPLVKVPGAAGWYRPARAHVPEEFGFNLIPLAVSAGSTVSCNFQPQSDPVRQSDWRACLVAVSNNGDARYSCLWNKGTNSITLSSDEGKLYLAVIAVPKPMKIADPMWKAYITDAGIQFPYAVSFTNATPRNAVYPRPSVTGTTHANGGGFKQNGTTVDASAYVGPNAMVLNTAQVRGNARIEDYAVVAGSAQIRDYAVVSGYARVEGTAQVYGNATVRDWARVFGNVQIYENAKVIEHANCGDTGNTVYGSAVMKGTTYVYSPSTFLGCLIMDGDSANGNSGVGGSNGVHFGWGWGQDTARFNQLTNNNYIYARHSFEKDNPVFAMDEYGINHGFLMNGARAAKDTAAPTRGGRVLPLDGVNQYVELHNSIADFKETAICVWVKWTGIAGGHRVWSMGDGAGKFMYLTPKDASSGNLRFVISDASTTEYLDGGSAMPANVWTHVAVVFSAAASSSILYVNGAAVATNAVATLYPADLNAPLMENSNYLGRGNAGDYFQGYLDDFRVYMKTLTAGEVSAVYAEAAPGPVTITPDTTAPTPNPATWLVTPTAPSDSAITMSATAGTDAGGWVEYCFTCTAGGGHDSGWVSFNKYTDVGLTPGTIHTYTVKMRDKNGNTTASSSEASAATQTSSAPLTVFASGPAGIANGQVRMTAVKIASPSGLVEYKFDRVTPSLATSGWQASPTWTDTGLAAGVSCSYTVTARDGRGNTSAASAAAATTANDKTAPKLPVPVGQWEMLPYATLDNKVSMTAMTPADGGSGVQYQFTCTLGGAPASAWQSSRTYVSPVLADGTYTYRYKARDAAGNETAYSAPYVATITPTSGYHTYSMPQLSGLPDDYLVSFNGVVTQVNPYSYIVKDPVTGISITVEDSGSRDGKTQTTLASNLQKNVNVKGHLYTRGGPRIVTFATVTPTGGGGTTYNISGKVVNPSGTGISGATVYISGAPNPSANPGFTATTDGSGNYTKAVPEGTWYVAAGSSAYNTSADQLVAVVGGNVPDVNFTLVGNVQMSGTVTRQSDGTPVSGATVYFSRSSNASAGPVYTATTNASGVYARSVQDGTWYVCAGAANFYTTTDQVVGVNGADVSNINFALISNTRNIPATGNLLFSCITDSFPASGATGNWATYLPAGQTLTMMGSPTVEIINGVKWERNYYSDGDGFDKGYYANPISCNGASIVVAVRPIRYSLPGNNWSSVVDVFYNRLVLGIRNHDGLVNVRRNGSLDFSATAIPDGQITILTLVVQPDGKYKVYANGAEVMNVTSTSAMTALVPGVPGGYAYNINVGRNNPDGWTTFNGNIGDVFLYDYALPDAERLQLEADLSAKFLGAASAYPITATAGIGGSISPSGTTMVNSGGSQTFTITPSANYAIEDVKVDGVSVGAVASRDFANVTASHSIAATFRPTAHTITASAGAGGTITPSGAVGVVDGGSRVFTIAPLPGYSITDVLVDAASVGAVGSYTFTNVIASHTISATFSQQTHTVTASAGPNGTITPSGAVVMDYTMQQTFTITPATGYAIQDVLVDGVSVGAVGSVPFSNVTTNHTISATFRLVPAPHTINASAGANGTISPNGAAAVNDGANLGVTITPSAGYAVHDVLVDGVSVGAMGNYTFINVTADHTISATFRSVMPVTGPTYTIAASAGTGGTISPSGPVLVSEGASQVFLIAPQPGYAIADVLVDGLSVGPVGVYPFVNVTADHTISATFQRPPAARVRNWELWE